MKIVRLYLPLQDNSGVPFPLHMFKDVEKELSERFGGVTAHTEAPASGLWRDGNTTHSDDIVIFEVILESADKGWWAGYRTRLETRFRQKNIMALLQEIEIL